MDDTLAEKWTKQFDFRNCWNIWDVKNYIYFLIKAFSKTKILIAAQNQL